MILVCSPLTRLRLRVANLLRRVRRRGVSYSRPYGSWREAREAAGGWDQAQILEKVAAATAKVLRGEAAAERDSVVFDHLDYAYPVMAALLRAALENQGRLRVLDYGGSLGSSYRQFRSFAHAGVEAEWHVVEQENFVRRGREEFETPALRFASSIGEAVRRAPPDVALASSVLQYLDDPGTVLEDLAASGARYLVLDRTPFSGANRDLFAVQHVAPDIYKASYACRIFSYGEFKASMERHWVLEGDFPSLDGWACAGRACFRHGGMLLRRKS